MTEDLIRDLAWWPGDVEARWHRASGDEVVVRFDRPPNSVCELERTAGVLVVHRPTEEPESNAIVFNADGSERGHVVPPPEFLSFYQAYWEGTRMRLFFDASGGYFGCRLDEETLQCSDIAEAR